MLGQYLSLLVFIAVVCLSLYFTMKAIKVVHEKFNEVELQLRDLKTKLASIEEANVVYLEEEEEEPLQAEPNIMDYVDEEENGVILEGENEGEDEPVKEEIIEPPINADNFDDEHV